MVSSLSVKLQALMACMALHGVIGQMGPMTKSCYSTDTAPYRGFSTKSLYEDVRGGRTVQEETVPGCEQTLFYGLFRHGTSFPNSSSSAEMRGLLPALQHKISQHSKDATICQQDLARLQTWQFRLRSVDESRLAPAGYQEMKDVAKRLKKRYPGLFKRQYRQSDFDIRHTHSERTKDSAHGFVEGLFNTTEQIKLTFAEEGHDRVLRYYDLCSRYLKDVEDVNVVELEKFIVSDVYTAMIRDVTKRLGLATNVLTPDDIESLHQMCAIDHAIYGDAPWCAAFSERDLKIFEYAADLFTYYEYGYGGPQLVRDMTCELMKDLINHLRDGEKSVDVHPKVVVRFGFSSSIQPFLAKLGLFKDSVDLRADNFAAHANRKWQTSLIGSFGANIVFVVYRCSGTTKVKALMNEDPIILPGCSDTVCDLNTALSTIGIFADTCYFDEICHNTGNPSNSVKHVSTWQYISILVVACALL